MLAVMLVSHHPQIPLRQRRRQGPTRRCDPKRKNVLPDARLSSSMTMQCAWYPMASPPYSSSAVIPRNPACPSFFHMSLGNSFCESVAAATCSVISRAVS